MQRSRLLSGIGLSVLLLSSATSSWAWWRGGGPRVGVYIGPGAWGYGGPYYDPYYGNGYDGYGYPNQDQYVVRQGPVQDESSQPDNSRYDLKFFNRQISRARDRAEFGYDDGDLTKEQYHAELDRLVEIKKEARAEAKVNGGYLSADQERELMTVLRNGGSVSETASMAPSNAPPQSKGELDRVNAEMKKTHALLDQKLASGDITNSQHDGMTSYLSRLNERVQADATSNDGDLSADQADTAIQQLDRVRLSVSKNLVGH